LTRLEARIDGLQAAMPEQMKAYMVTTIGDMTVNTAVFGAMLGVFR